MDRLIATYPEVPSPAQTMPEAMLLPPDQQAFVDWSTAYHEAQGDSIAQEAHLWEISAKVLTEASDPDEREAIQLVTGMIHYASFPTQPGESVPEGLEVIQDAMGVYRLTLAPGFNREKLLKAEDTLFADGSLRALLDEMAQNKSHIQLQEGLRRLMYQSPPIRMLHEVGPHEEAASHRPPEYAIRSQAQQAAIRQTGIDPLASPAMQAAPILHRLRNINPRANVYGTMMLRHYVVSSRAAQRIYDRQQQALEEFMDPVAYAGGAKNGLTPAQIAATQARLVSRLERMVGASDHMSATITIGILDTQRRDSLAERGMRLAQTAAARFDPYTIHPLTSRLFLSVCGDILQNPERITRQGRDWEGYLAHRLHYIPLDGADYRFVMYPMFGNGERFVKYIDTPSAQSLITLKQPRPGTGTALHYPLLPENVRFQDGPGAERGNIVYLSGDGRIPLLMQIPGVAGADKFANLSRFVEGGADNVEGDTQNAETAPDSGSVHLASAATAEGADLPADGSAAETADPYTEDLPADGLPSVAQGAGEAALTLSIAGGKSESDALSPLSLARILSKMGELGANQSSFDAASASEIDLSQMHGLAVGEKAPNSSETFTLSEDGEPVHLVEDADDLPGEDINEGVDGIDAIRLVDEAEHTLRTHGLERFSWFDGKPGVHEKLRWRDAPLLALAPIAVPALLAYDGWKYLRRKLMERKTGSVPATEGEPSPADTGPIESKVEQAEDDISLEFKEMEETNIGAVVAVGENVPLEYCLLQFTPEPVSLPLRESEANPADLVLLFKPDTLEATATPRVTGYELVAWDPSRPRAAFRRSTKNNPNDEDIALSSEQAAAAAAACYAIGMQALGDQISQASDLSVRSLVRLVQNNSYWRDTPDPTVPAGKSGRTSFAIRQFGDLRDFVDAEGQIGLQCSGHYHSSAQLIKEILITARVRPASGHSLLTRAQFQISSPQHVQMEIVNDGRTLLVETGASKRDAEDGAMAMEEKLGLQEGDGEIDKPKSALETDQEDDSPLGDDLPSDDLDGTDEEPKELPANAGAQVGETAADVMADVAMKEFQATLEKQTEKFVDYLNSKKIPRQLFLDQTVRLGQDHPVYRTLTLVYTTNHFLRTRLGMLTPSNFHTLQDGYTPELIDALEPGEVPSTETVETLLMAAEDLQQYLDKLLKAGRAPMDGVLRSQRMSREYTGNTELLYMREMAERIGRELRSWR